jgi:BirA family transcriptional regulator, biotin operon repressor / biotin---[acetyl-CoA-carboxylase] ligase
VNFDLQRLERSLNNTPVIESLGELHGISLNEGGFPEFKVQVLESVASTNTIVWERLQGGAATGTVVIALQQQAGRGQRGHQWLSQPGGLYLSLGLTANLPITQAGQLTLGSAWGIAAALRGYGVPVAIKWLNDLVVDGYKLGGILTETRIAGEQISQAVIGVGLNWSNPVPAMAINVQQVLSKKVATKPATSQPIDSLEVLAAIVLQGLKLGYLHWQQRGSNRLVAAYERLCVNCGHAVTIDGQIGTIVGVTATGQLRVQLHSSGNEIYLEPGSISLGYATKPDCPGDRFYGMHECPD